MPPRRNPPQFGTILGPPPSAYVQQTAPTPVQPPAPQPGPSPQAAQAVEERALPIPSPPSSPSQPPSNPTPPPAYRPLDDLKHLIQPAAMFNRGQPPPYDTYQEGPLPSTLRPGMVRSCVPVNPNIIGPPRMPSGAAPAGYMNNSTHVLGVAPPPPARVDFDARRYAREGWGRPIGPGSASPRRSGWGGGGRGGGGGGGSGFDGGAGFGGNLNRGFSWDSWASQGGWRPPGSMDDSSFSLSW